MNLVLWQYAVSSAKGIWRDMSAATSSHLEMAFNRGDKKVQMEVEDVEGGKPPLKVEFDFDAMTQKADIKRRIRRVILPQDGASKLEKVKGNEDSEGISMKSPKKQIRELADEYLMIWSRGEKL